MNIKDRIKLLQEVYDSLDWESYMELSESIVRINKDIINDELSNHSSIYAYYAGLLQRARLDYQKEELKFNQFCAKIKKDEFASYRIRNKDKPTDKYLENHAISLEEYPKYYNSMIEAEYKYNLLKSLARALEDRKDLLVQLSSNSRAEANLYKI